MIAPKRRAGSTAKLVLVGAISVFSLTAQAVPAPAPVPTTHPSVAPTTQHIAVAAPRSEIESQPIRRSGANQPAAPTTAQSATATRQVTIGSSGSSFDVQRVGISLAIVIGIILAARFAMRKLFPAATVGRSSQAIKVLSRSVLAPKQQFLLLQVGKRLIVVGDSGTNMSALSEISDPDEVASLIGQLSSESSQSAVASFGSLFRKANVEFHREEETALRAADPVEHDDDDEVEMPAAADPVLEGAAGDIKGLMDRVKFLTKELRRS
jgi:flagellar biogenesis protein FliO